LGDRYVEVPGGGFGDTAAVPPGQSNYQVLVGYEMPYERRLELVHKLSMPANAVVVLVPAGNIQVEGENLQDAGTQDAQGIQYQMYNRPGLAAGEELVLTVTGGVAAGGSVLSAGSDNTLLIGVGAFGLALVLVGGLLYLRSRNTMEEDDAADELPQADGIPEDRETLMDAILALDDQFQNGELSEGAYRTRRAELKARLQSLMD
jgi:hypothetical protein